MSDIVAPLRFIRRQATKPYFHSAHLTGAKPEFFFETEAHMVPIRDMRPIADSLSIDEQGFVLLRHETTAADLYDEDEVSGIYYPELEALLRETLGADRVAIFDSTRRSDKRGGAANQDGARRPAAHIHNDYTIQSGPQRVRDVLGEEADRLLDEGARIIQINVWRPIVSPVERSPLAVADASSISEVDLIATDHVFPDRVGEIYHVAYDPMQRWCYAPHMTRDEVILIKGWDSLDDGRARFTPHTAFEWPNTDPEAAPRESIETRTLVIIE